MNRDFLVAKYDLLFGKRPPGFMKDETMKQRIEQELDMRRASGIRVPLDEEVELRMATVVNAPEETIVVDIPVEPVVEKINIPSTEIRTINVAPEKTEEEIKQEEEKNKFEAWKINTKQGETPEMPSSPCIIDGIPMYLVGDRYVSYDDGMYTYHEKMVEYHRKELKKFKKY